MGVIARADPRATLFAVYALLENLGYGFYLSYDSHPEPRKCSFQFERFGSSLTLPLHRKESSSSEIHGIAAPRRFTNPTGIEFGLALSWLRGRSMPSGVTGILSISVGFTLASRYCCPAGNLMAAVAPGRPGQVDRGSKRTKLHHHRKLGAKPH